MTIVDPYSLIVGIIIGAFFAGPLALWLIAALAVQQRLGLVNPLRDSAPSGSSLSQPTPQLRDSQSHPTSMQRRGRSRRASPWPPQK
jgi:hypothetical protein